MNKKAFAAIGGLAAFGILTAAAASLGGLTSSSLGADQTVIASCDTDGIVLSYTNSYNTGTNVYTTTAVVATGVNPTCAGKIAKLSLENGSTLIGEYPLNPVVVTGGNTMTIPISPAVNSSTITAAALVITG
jgi:hypothetical protein